MVTVLRAHLQGSGKYAVFGDGGTGLGQVAGETYDNYANAMTKQRAAVHPISIITNYYCATAN